MPNYRYLSVLSRTLQITAPCAIQLPLKFCSILTQCHLGKYLKALHKPVVASSLYGKAPRATCLRLQSGLMKEQQREPRTEAPHFPWSSWQCFPPQRQHVLDTALVYAYSKLPGQATEHTHPILFQELLLLSALFQITGDWEVVGKTQVLFCYVSFICSSCPSLLTGSKCYLWNSYWKFADISQIR